MIRVCVLPGWGFSPAVFSRLRSALPRDWQYEEIPLAPLPAEPLIEWGKRLADGISPGTVALGWSLGAQLALAAACRGAPFSAIVALAASPRFCATEDWKAGLAASTVDTFCRDWELAPEKTRKRFLALQALGDAKRSELLAALEPAKLPLDSPGLGDALAALARGDLRAQTGAIKAPTLLIHGEADALMPVAAAQWLATHLPDAKLHVLPKCGHAPHLSQPENVAQFIARFLAQLPKDCA